VDHDQVPGPGNRCAAIDVPGDGAELASEPVPHDCSADAAGHGEGQACGITGIGITLGDDERDGTPTNPAG
jgi:hypothetical protein